jgi:hypothetical protein
MLLLPLALIALLLLIDPPKQAVRERVANPPSPPPPAGPRTLRELTAEYDTKSAEYKRLIDQAVSNGETSNMEQIRSLNVELSNLLEQMISTAEPDRRDVRHLRDELVSRLRRIQLDYNGLLQTTDELETLRRIRAQESDGFLRVFYWHLVFLGIAFAVVLFGMIYVRRATTNATTNSPTTSADLV